MLSKKQRVNVVPNVGEELFFSNQIDMRFYPDSFKIDFKQINQQVDRIGDQKNDSIVINRRSIALTPMIMKQFVLIVNNILATYEKQHGEIKLPKVIKTRKVKANKSSGYIG
ncbi:MAG: hypothetical protein WC307_05425 [Candidatus Nanoarchaeia archaeon]|jgi:hypothetical protein